MYSAVNRKLPNQYIRDIRGFLDANEEITEELSVIRLDIKSFYDSIPHDKLLPIVGEYVSDKEALALIRNAIRTPTIAETSPKPIRGHALNLVGVPQGLPISNILANVYLFEIDKKFSQLALLYFRYVDDVLVVDRTDKIEQLKQDMENDILQMGLKVNVAKSYHRKITTKFEYLGYSFSIPTKISIRQSSYERFLRSVARLFSRYRYRLRSKDFPAYLSADLRRSAFVDEINERITGAFSETRRYGWLFYFIEMNDQKLLYTLDGSIRNLFERLDDFNNTCPDNLKKLSRAYYEAKFSPDSGYILNYNKFNTIKLRLDFLISRGQMKEAGSDELSAEEINKRFEAYRNHQIQQLDADVGFLS